MTLMISHAGASAPSGYAREIRGLAVAGAFTMVAFFGGLGAWATQAAWSGAVVATGQIVVENNVQRVQHSTGGIVGQLAVREGQRVREGDLLLRLDDTATRANLQIIVKQLDELQMRSARLQAERDRQPTFTPGIPDARRGDAEFAQLVTAETALFAARAAAREGQRRQLVSRIAQMRNEVEGVKAQEESIRRQYEFINDELADVRTLFRQNLVSVSRLNTLERTAAALIGQQGLLASQQSQLENRIAETELQIVQIDAELLAQTTGELRQIQAEIAGLVERRTAAEDQLRRIEIRAPATGTVHQMTTNTIGGVVTPGEPVMFIVPAEERLQLEARVAPQDIDQIALNQTARIRIKAFNQRTTPEIEGQVARISADAARDPQGAPYFAVRVAIPPEAIETIGQGRLIAGMQAEVFIGTETRTPLDYLIRPIRDQYERAFRER